MLSFTSPLSKKAVPLAVLCALLASCDKPAASSTEARGVLPASIEKAAPRLVERTPTGEPVVYSQSYFSVTSETGVTGYPPGTRLTLVEEKGSKAVVKDSYGAKIEVDRAKITHAKPPSADAITSLSPSDYSPVATSVRPKLSVAAIAPRLGIAPVAKTAPRVSSIAPPKSLLSDSERPALPQCSQKHWGGIYHRSVTGSYYVCPVGVYKD